MHDFREGLRFHYMLDVFIDFTTKFSTSTDSFRIWQQSLYPVGIFQIFFLFVIDFKCQFMMGTSSDVFEFASNVCLKHSAETLHSMGYL